ncbi:unnamed protein product [Heligmosomoides polygyrus]|uniref:Peptidase A2 domain-containing protein n=1 Tax=Heligmosomoides polygyrus TaxID=6339 RepID=A0A183GFQ8_HELPZ|nr:unnamed protein product [Heligmosomoides polygyrus]
MLQVVCHHRQQWNLLPEDQMPTEEKTRFEEFDELKTGRERWHREGLNVSQLRTIFDQDTAEQRFIALPEVRCYLRYDAIQEVIEIIPGKILSKLSGMAKAQYEALPRDIRRGLFEGIVEALGDVNRVDSQTGKVMALGKLRRLRKTEAQSIAEYCVELERITAKAYPELDERALDTTKAQQLYEQVVHWPVSYYFLEAMEEGGNNAYAKLKEVAMRVERRRLTMDNFRKQRQRNAEPRLGEVREAMTHKQKPHLLQGIKDGAAVSKESAPHSPAKKETNVPLTKTVRGCCRCQGTTHLAKNCPQRRAFGSKAAEVEARNESGGGRRPNGEAPLSYGQTFITKVKILGREFSALLDTGSEISILPEAILRQLRKEGCRITEIAVDSARKIRDASGDHMKFMWFPEASLISGVSDG